MFNFVANAAAVASLISVGSEAKNGGIKEGRKGAITSVAVYDIQNATGDTLLNMKSSKHNAMKQAVRDTDLLSGLYKVKGAISGFGKGVYDNIRRNLATTIFAVGTLAVKNKTAKTIGVTGMLMSIVWDFLDNGTNLFTKTDTIEK